MIFSDFFSLFFKGGGELFQSFIFVFLWIRCLLVSASQPFVSVLPVVSIVSFGWFRYFSWFRFGGFGILAGFVSAVSVF